MKKNLLLAFASIALTVFAAAPASAQVCSEPECVRAREIRDEIAGLTTICPADPAPDHEARVRALLNEAAQANLDCQTRNAECGRLYQISVAVIANGCAGSAIAGLDDLSCGQICTQRGHGTWCAPGDSRDECQCARGEAGRYCRSARRTDASWCSPAAGWRIANRCRTVRVRIGPPPPPPDGRCNIRIDTDSDGVPDVSSECIPMDNCRTVANSLQEDNDVDGEGNLCDEDDDLGPVRLRYRADVQQLCVTVGEGETPTASCVTLQDFVNGGEPPVTGEFIDQWAREQIRDLWEAIGYLYEADDCLQNGRRFGRATHEERVVPEGESEDRAMRVVRTDRPVCLEQCTLDGAVYNRETHRCELPASRDGRDGSNGEVTVSVEYLYYIDHVIALEASGAFGLTDDGRLRLRGFVGLGISPEIDQNHTTAGVGFGGVGLDYAIVDERMVQFALGLGGFVLGSVEFDSGDNPFAGGGGYVDAQLEIGDRNGVRFLLNGRFVAGYCDMSWGEPGACAGGGGGLGIAIPW